MNDLPVRNSDETPSARESLSVRMVNQTTRLTGIVAGYAFLGLSLLIVVEILGRKFLNVSIQGVDEIGAYIVAVAGAYGMSLAAWHRAHTRIDILLAHLPPHIRTLMDCMAYLGLALGAGFMVYMAWQVFNETVDFKAVASTPLQTPLWIPQVAWLSGYMLFSLISIFMFIRGCSLLVSGSPEAQHFLAPTSVREEIEDVQE